MGFLKKIKEKLSWKTAAAAGVAVVAVGILVLGLTMGKKPADVPGGATADTPTETVQTDPVTGQTEQTLPGVTRPDEAPDTVTEPQGSDQPVTEPQGGDQPTTEPQGTQEPVTGPEGTDVPVTPPQTLRPEPQQPEKKELLVCERTASFNGEFVEDGSNAPVENVAALLVTNTSEQFLNLGQLNYRIDGKEAKFLVRGLPAGESAWVLEASGTTVTADSVFEKGSVTTSFHADALTFVPGLEIASDGTTLQVTNTTEAAMENVTLYYKVRHTDGNYLGGIAYMVSFGTLEPGQSAQSIAGHFKEGWTDIVRISYQEVS